jgi:alpha-ketoglutarate-dependent taurine dioxygenase
MEDELKKSDGAPFVWSRRKAVTVSSQDLVTIDLLDSSRNLPLVIRSRSDGLDLIGWTQANLSMIKSRLLRHGAILFRSFPVTRPEQFRQFVEIVSGEALPYRERTSPRTQVIENVYTSTDYPSNESIFPHNENSYAITFPRKLFFWCETPAREGGETPLGDTRKILARLHPSVMDKFREKGWMYVRNFSSHFGLTWQTAFQTSDRAQVEDYCRKGGIVCEWTAHGLRTRQTRPAVTRHPESHELIWFNHAAFFNILSVESALRAWLLAEYGEEDLPNNTYYGDGSPIEDWAVHHLREAYMNEMVSFPWEQGDVVLIDNMLTAHARAPFAGPRRILVAMAEPYTRPDLPGIPSEIR